MNLKNQKCIIGIKFVAKYNLGLQVGFWSNYYLKHTLKHV